MTFVILKFTLRKHTLNNCVNKRLCLLYEKAYTIDLLVMSLNCLIILGTVVPCRKRAARAVKTADAAHPGILSIYIDFLKTTNF